MRPAVLIALVMLVFALSLPAHTIRTHAPGEPPLVEMNPEIPFINLIEHGVLLAVDAGITPETIANPTHPFDTRIIQDESVNLGVNEDPVLVTTRVRNASNAPATYVLQVLNPRMEQATLSILDPLTGKRTFTLTQGAFAPQSAHDFFSITPAFKVEMQPGETRQLDLLLGHTGAMRFQIRLWSEEGFRLHTYWSLFGHAVIFGALLILTLINALVFFGLGERAYAYLTIMMTALCVYFLSGSGMGNLFVWEPSLFWSDRAITFCLMIIIGSAFLFVAHFFGPALPARLFNGLRISGGVVIFGSCLAFTPGLPKYYVAHAATIIGMIVVLSTAVYAWRRGLPGARHYLVAWTFVLLGGISLGLLGLGILPYTFLTEHLLTIAFAPGAIVWHYALASRVKEREERAREVLERTVEERTAALRTALSEVKQLSGLLPICSSCKKIRDDKGYWSSVEGYLHEHTDARLSHGICPDCTDALYPEFAEKMRGQQRSAVIGETSIEPGGDRP